MPDWYAYLRAADRLHCSPWELLSAAEQGLVSRRWWMLWSVIASGAEAGVRKALAKSEGRG